MRGVIVLVVVVVCGLGAATASASQPTVHSYAGTYSGSASLKETESPYGFGNGFTLTQSLTWSVKVVDDYHNGHLVSGTVNQVARGTVTYVCLPGDGQTCSPPSTTCTITQANQHPRADNGAAGMVGPDALGVDGGFHIPLLSQAGLPGACGYLDVSTGWLGDGCAVLPGNQTNTFDDALVNAYVFSRTGKGAKSYDTDQSATATCQGQPDTITRTMSAVVSIGGATGKHHKPHRQTNDVERKIEKLTALKDLLVALKLTRVPCGVSSLGLTSGVWGVSVGGLGGLALVPATLIGAIHGKTCYDLITRIMDDAQIANDPPDAHYTLLARVGRVARAKPNTAACARWHGSVRAFCISVATKLAAYATAMAQATAIDHAILTTIDRQTAAINAGATRALAKQDAAAKVLESRFGRALSAESRAGRALARLISGHGVFARLTAAQDGEAIAAASAQLARHSVTRPSALAAVLGAATLRAADAPRPVDLLSLLR